MEFKVQNLKFKVGLAIGLLLTLSPGAPAEDFNSLCADRAVVERIYYHHRTGQKPPFNQVLPPSTIETLVRTDLRKEAVLKKVYNMKITAPQLDTEVSRINSTTRAPEMLAEIKAALGGDATRFAETFARPIMVERMLREKFDNDDALHAPQRRMVEQARERLLAAKREGATPVKLTGLLRTAGSNQVTEMIWQLGDRAAQTNNSDGKSPELPGQFGTNAQILSGSSAMAEKFYFSDLTPELQNVLRVQLRQPGDISAVIETPAEFLLYVSLEKTPAILRVAVWSAPKRSYEEWVAAVATEKN